MSSFNVPDNVFPWIKETLFRDRYLPAFVNGDNEMCLEWVERISISPFAKVRVVDDNDIDKVLFEVPPLMRGPETQIGGNLNAVMRTAGVIAETYSKKVTEKYVKETLGGRFVADNESDEDVEAWIEIAERYGYSKAQADSTTPEEGSDGLVNEEEDWD